MMKGSGKIFLLRLIDGENDLMKKLISYGGLLCGVLALSTSGIFVKLAEAPSAITAFYRLLFALLILIPFVLLSRERRAELLTLPLKNRVLSVLSGVLLAIHYILWFESLRHTSLASSTVLVTLQPVFTILFSFLFLRERQTKIGMTGCLVALVGSFIIGYGDFRTGTEALMGDLMALLAAALISMYFFIGQQLRKDTSATVYSVLGYSGSVVFLAVYALLRQEPFFGYELPVWQCFLGLGLVSTVLGQFVFNLLLKWLPATTISMSILGEPVGTCILGYFILQETIGFRQGLGMLVILGGLRVYFLAEPLGRMFHRKQA